LGAIIRLTAQNAYQETFDLNADDEFLAVASTSYGGSVSGGYSTGVPYGGLVVKLDALGNVQWSKTVGGTRITPFFQSQEKIGSVWGDQFRFGNH